MIKKMVVILEDSRQLHQLLGINRVYCPHCGGHLVMHWGICDIVDLKTDEVIDQVYSYECMDTKRCGYEWDVPLTEVLV